MKHFFFLFFLTINIANCAENFFILDSGNTLKVTSSEQTIKMELLKLESEKKLRTILVSTQELTKYIDSQLNINQIKAKSGQSLLGFKSIMGVIWAYIFWGHLSENNKITKYLSKHRKKFLVKKEKFVNKKWVKAIFKDCNTYLSNLPEFLWISHNVAEASYGLYLYKSSSNAYDNFQLFKDNIIENLNEGKVLQEKFILKMLNALEGKD